MGKTKINTVGEEAQEKKQKPEKKEKVHLAGLKGGQRIQVIEAEPPLEAQDATEVAETQKKSTRHKGKKYLTARAKVDPKKVYPLAEAAKLLKETSVSKFEGSVELHLVLNTDNINTRVELPHSTGKKRRVEIAGEETIEKLKAGKIDFDVLIASPETMPKLVPFAKLLGPKGLMPNPKNGTLVPDPKKAIDQFGANQITVRTEKSAPLTHNVVAKLSQPEREIEENIKAVIKNVGERNIKKAVASASMGPGIRISV